MSHLLELKRDTTPPTPQERAYLLAGLSDHLKKAVEKHPHFAASLTIESRDDVRFALKFSRIKNFESSPFGVVELLQEEERLECTEAYLNGDIAGAIDEAFDEFAVVARKIIFLKRMISK